MRSHTLSVTTDRSQQMLDITAEIRRVLKDSGVTSGTVGVFVPHTTAGVTINENVDPDVVRDLLAELDRMVPWDNPDHRHGEGNSAAHVKASMVGASVMIPVDQGRLALGTWQAVYFCEFDGPRSRRVAVQLLNAPAER